MQVKHSVRVCVLPSGRILFTQKTHARTNPMERKNKKKCKEKVPKQKLHLLMSHKTKEKGEVKRSNNHGMKRKRIVA